MKKPVILIIANIIFILMLTLVQVVVANNLSTTGIELGEVQEKISSYKKTNAILHEQVLTASSLSSIASSAGQLGFEEIKASAMVATQPPLAVR